MPESEGDALAAPVRAPRTTAGTPPASATALPPPAGPARFPRLTRLLARADAFARGRGALVVLFGLALLAAAAASLGERGFHAPVVHDEFAYLLGADTFAHGRLTNPTHPLWPFFETYEVLQRPSYASKFPPAQSIFLAIGQRVTGQPATGAWLGFAFMCVALLWMLRAWVPPRWALAVSFAFTCALATTYWANSYWGGAVAAGAAALVYGGLRRVLTRDRPRPRDAVLLALGLLLLANSRPFEGLVASTPAGVLLLVWLARTPAGKRRDRLVRVVLPLVLVLGAGAGAMMAYNRAVTGDPLLLPHVLYQRGYDPTPVFTFGRPYAPPDTPSSMWDYHKIYAVHADTFRAQGYWRGVHTRAYTLLLFLWPSRLLFLGLLLALAARDRWVTLALGAAVFGFLALGFETWRFMHYRAPLVPVIVAAWAGGVLAARRFRLRGRPVGRYLALALVLAWAVRGLWEIGYVVQHPSRPGWGEFRRQTEGAVAAAGEKSLVLVSYGPQHNYMSEWVVNAADIDAAPVVWAHDLGPAQNARLFAYFRGRRLWKLYVNADADPINLVPLPSGP